MVTVPLRQAGYWTAAVGKWHLGQQVAKQFDYRKGASPTEMGEAWTETLRTRPQGRPFFFWAAHSDPHRGYKPGAVEPPHTRDDAIVPPYFPDTPEVRDDLALYYDEVCRFDQHVGMVLKELDRQGVADNTFVLVMSDNGRPFPHCKTRVNVPGVRTPFVVRWPGHVQPGTKTGNVVSSVDIAATVLDLAGIEPLESFQGVSFAPILANPQTDVRPFAFAEHNWHDYRAFERAVHGKQYCYVRNWLPRTPATPPADAVKSPTYRVMKQLHANGQLKPAQQTCFTIPRPMEFLFDVVADPHCLHNLAAEAVYEATLDEMRRALVQWQQETGDQFPGENKLTPDGFDRHSGDRMMPGPHPAFLKK